MYSCIKDMRGQVDQDHRNLIPFVDKPQRLKLVHLDQCMFCIDVDGKKSLVNYQCRRKLATGAKGGLITFVFDNFTYPLWFID